MLAPATFTPGASMRRKYHSAGVVSFKCGSLASSGWPVSVCVPLSTQLFEPMPSTPDSGAKFSACWPSLPSIFKSWNSAA